MSRTKTPAFGKHSRTLLLGIGVCFLTAMAACDASESPTAPAKTGPLEILPQFSVSWSHAKREAFLYSDVGHSVGFAYRFGDIGGESPSDCWFTLTVDVASPNIQWSLDPDEVVTALPMPKPGSGEATLYAEMVQPFPRDVEPGRKSKATVTAKCSYPYSYATGDGSIYVYGLSDPGDMGPWQGTITGFGETEHLGLPPSEYRWTWGTWYQAQLVTGGEGWVGPEDRAEIPLYREFAPGSVFFADADVVVAHVSPETVATRETASVKAAVEEGRILVLPNISFEALVPLLGVEVESFTYTGTEKEFAFPFLRLGGGVIVGGAYPTIQLARLSWSQYVYGYYYFPWADAYEFATALNHLFAALGNQAPTVDLAEDVVVVEEGLVARNSITVGDPDGDAVGLTASVGSLSDNGDGTWSWEFPTHDGPWESQVVTLTADDNRGGVAEATFQLTVDNVDPIITAVTVPPGPVSVGNQPISAGGAFVDPAGAADAPYECWVDYGDGSGLLAGIATDNTCTGPEHTYPGAGVYTVSLVVRDKDGGTANLESETLVVIYDPAGGFVTGGGWFESPPGAFKLDDTLTGKATFGFVAKYRKGAQVPEGNTEFQFKAGAINFHSTSYDWLVVNQNGENAQFRGTGTINGTGLYKFTLWAGDGNPDTFRILITEVGGGIIYDNGMDQEIGGGSILVHAK